MYCVVNFIHTAITDNSVLDAPTAAFIENVETSNQNTEKHLQNRNLGTDNYQAALELSMLEGFAQLSPLSPPSLDACGRARLLRKRT